MRRATEVVSPITDVARHRAESGGRRGVSPVRISRNYPPHRTPRVPIPIPIAGALHRRGRESRVYSHSYIVAVASVYEVGDDVKLAATDYYLSTDRYVFQEFLVLRRSGKTALRLLTINSYRQRSSDFRPFLPAALPVVATVECYRSRGKNCFKYAA